MAVTPSSFSAAGKTQQVQAEREKYGAICRTPYSEPAGSAERSWVRSPWRVPVPRLRESRAQGELPSALKLPAAPPKIRPGPRQRNRSNNLFSTKNEPTHWVFCKQHLLERWNNIMQGQLICLSADIDWLIDWSVCSGREKREKPEEQRIRRCLCF